MLLCMLWRSHYGQWSQLLINHWSSCFTWQNYQRMLIGFWKSILRTVGAPVSDSGVTHLVRCFNRHSACSNLVETPITLQKASAPSRNWATIVMAGITGIPTLALTFKLSEHVGPGWPCTMSRFVKQPIHRSRPFFSAFSIPASNPFFVCGCPRRAPVHASAGIQYCLPLSVYIYWMLP